MHLYFNYLGKHWAKIAPNLALYQPIWNLKDTLTETLGSTLNQ